MKLVKEYLNEKFEENSDPIKDMEIGTHEVMSYAIKTILNEDAKNHYLHYRTGTDRNIKKIVIDGGYGIPRKFKISFWTGRLKDKNNKQINRRNYAISLVEKTGIIDFFKDNVEYEYHDIHTVVFSIKPEYVKYFINGVHY